MFALKFRLKLAIIVMSIFATNSMLHAQYAPCEQECDPPAKWEWNKVIISLPQWPDCKIQYMFEERTCNGLHEIRGGSIMPLTSIGCDAMFRWIIGNADNNEGFADRLEEVMTQAFQQVSDDYFMNLFDNTPPPFNDAFNCKNPPDHRHGGTTTYIRAKCVSYCAAQWMQAGELQTQYTADDCGRDGCCKIIRTYCWDFDKNEMQVKETMETSVGNCDPNQDPPKPGCIPEGVSMENVMFLYNSTCKPICK